MSYANIKKIDVPAVAKHFGINHNAARLRVSRLKKKLNKMEASTKSGGQDNGEDSDKDGSQDETQTKKPDETNAADDQEFMNKPLPDLD
jgi:Holliday junction resolvasome RuvABC DNA-binding subunit